jgi:hypothetical protein
MEERTDKAWGTVGAWRAPAWLRWIAVVIPLIKEEASTMPEIHFFILIIN